MDEPWTETERKWACELQEEHARADEYRSLIRRHLRGLPPLVLRALVRLESSAESAGFTAGYAAGVMDSDRFAEWLKMWREMRELESDYAHRDGSNRPRNPLCPVPGWV